MTRTTETNTSRQIDWAGVITGVLLVIVATAAYHNSFSGPFVFDAQASIIDNPTIRHLWPMGPVLNPPHGGSTVDSRPILNLSFAVNYALGGGSVWGYHFVNFAIHCFAALILFGIVRQSLIGPVQAKPQSSKAEKRAFFVAFATAILWVVHPLQTDSVTNVAQRAESLMGLCYLLTLYSFIRGAITQVSLARCSWFCGSVMACFLGVGTKEVMVTAPFIVLLYDRTFFAGSFSNAWRLRRDFYLCHGASLLFCAYLLSGSSSRGGTVGFSTAIPWWRYSELQFGAIAHYLWLAAWPNPLVIDYGLNWGRSPFVLLADGLCIALFVVVTIFGLWRRSPIGFLGAWFFGILAPTSSIVPIATEIVAEHRMYLPLAALALFAGLALDHLGGRSKWLLLTVMVVALTAVTAARNEIYRSKVTLWRDTAINMPENAGAHNNLGNALAERGEWLAAIKEYDKALQINPALAGTYNNLGVLWYRNGKVPEAIANFRKTIQIDPRFASARRNMTRALLDLGRIQESLTEFYEANRLQPYSAQELNELGLAYANSGAMPEAAKMYEQALRKDPDNADAHFNLANSLAQTGQLTAAIGEYQASLKQEPDRAEAENNLGSALLQANRAEEALSHFEEAIRLKPNFAEAEMNSGNALLTTGDVVKAVARYEKSLRLRPDYYEAHHNLAIALLRLGRTEDSKFHLEIANRLARLHPRQDH